MSNLLKESYEFLEEQAKRESIQVFNDQQLYFYGFYGDTTENSH